MGRIVWGASLGVTAKSAIARERRRTPISARAPLGPDTDLRTHPRRIGWVGTTALAIGGSNQMIFLITALFVGQDAIPGQGSAAVPLLLLGLLLSYAAAPGWTELILMSPDRVGGIAAACTAAFRPYNPILSALTGICYWWGWVPTCGVTAILSAAAISQWCLPGVPVPLLACAIVGFFTVINLCGINWVVRLAIPVAVLSAFLAFVSMLAPVASGQVDWRRAFDFELTSPFPGWFGALTSCMAGIYLIGFGAPAFEAAACHVGETIAPARNVPRAMLASAGMAAVYFALLPLIWLGALGPAALGEDLAGVLGPTFAPLFGNLAKSAAFGFMIFNMFHGTLQPLAGASRTLSQLSEDGMLPSFLAHRLPSDAPWAATLLTAGFAILFLLIGDPIWLIAAANFCYLIGVCLPSVAVWLLRRDAPLAERPYRAPRGTIALGLAGAAVWIASALLGFEQFGLPTVVFALLMAYSGPALYAWRKLEDRWRQGLKGFGRSLHIKLTGAMLLVLALDAAGYILAVAKIPPSQVSLIVALEDIFVMVAVLTITVGIVLPGMIAHSADQVSVAAHRLAGGTLRDFARAMDALGEGNLDGAHASIEIVPVVVRSRDELGTMAGSFNRLQQSVQHAVLGLDRAREGLRAARAQLVESNAALGKTVEEQNRLTVELMQAKEAALHDAMHDPLTGLPNRTLFMERLRAAWANCRSHGALDASLLFIDLDRFKIINDSMGHVAGDNLIVQVATRLRRLLRDETGSPSHHAQSGCDCDTLARLGGDEFTLLLTEISSVQDALVVAARIQDALKRPFIVEQQEVYSEASIGIAANFASYASADDLLRDADLAMYRAKTLGRARAEVFDPGMLASATARLHLESDLRRALESGEFVLYYQPIVSLESRAVVGFEALVRWDVPGRGLVYPDEFISIAEETGMIIPLGRWVLFEACRTARRWHTERTRDTSLTVSINISPRQFAQPDLVDDVREVLRQTGVDPSMVKLEITESSTMDDPERAVRVLTEIKSLGIELSIDDFGTGYSSLAYLHRFPLDILKIDRSFVSGLLKNAESHEIVATIMALAGGMDMRVVAEGVEAEPQIVALQRLGCEFGQGLVFAKALPAEQVPAFLAEWNVNRAHPDPNGSAADDPAALVPAE